MSKLVFSIDDANLSSEGTVARIHPGSGVAIQFKEMSRESREKMYRILEFVQSTTTDVQRPLLAETIQPLIVCY
jgi:hypothetical protein